MPKYILLCYAVGAVIVAVYYIGTFIFEMGLIKSGELAEATIPLQSFTLDAIEKSEGEQGNYVTTSDDPKMVINFEGGRYINNLTYEVEYDKFPGEVTMYYTLSQDSAFSERYRLWAVASEDGKRYTFTMPTKKVYGVRIDPATFNGFDIKLGDTFINAPKPKGGYFVVSNAHMFLLLVCPLVFAAFTVQFAEFYKQLFKKRK